MVQGQRREPALARSAHPLDKLGLLSKARVGTSVPTQDIERASAFYRDKLGLESTRTDPVGNRHFDCGDGTFFYLFESMGKASGSHTQFAFEVEDLDAVVAELSSNGVIFEQYDYPELKTDERGIATLEQERAAWVVDSEGNLLVIVQRGIQE